MSSQDFQEMANTLRQIRSVSLPAFAGLIAICLSSCESNARLEPVASEVVNVSNLGSEALVELQIPPGLDMIAVFDASGAQVSVRPREVAGDDSNVSTVPYLRNARLLWPIPSAATNRTIEFGLASTQSTRNAQVEFHAFGLTGTKRERNEILSAYELYSRALAVTESEAPEVWKPRALDLLHAEKLLRRHGLIEDALWARMLAGYFYYYPIYDYVQAIRLLAEVRDEALLQGFDKLALAATQNLAFTLLERNDSDTQAQALAKQDEAQLRFDQAIELAERLGMEFEAAWAINGKGIGYFYQDRHAEALQHYDQALPRAIDLKDRYFINLVQGNRALALERLGRGTEALEVLRSIAASFDASTDKNLLVDNLAEQGRILKDMHRLPEAVETLTRAIEVAQSIQSVNALGRLQINLSRVYYEMGMMPRARQIALEAEPNLRQSNNGRGLREHYQLLANVYRFEGDHEAMAAMRTEHGLAVLSDRDRALWLLDKAEDLQHFNGSAEEAAARLAEALQLAQTLDDAPLQQSLRLALCSVALVDTVCNLEVLRSDYADLSVSVLPRQYLQVMEYWGAILLASGERAEAREVFEAMLERMAFYRAALPGVLGAWYWERRSSVFNTVMKLAIEADLASGGGTDSLLLFERLRNLTLDTPTLGSSAIPDGRLRELIALRSRHSSPEQTEALEREFDQLLLASGKQVIGESWSARKSALEAALHEYSQSATLLAYYFGNEAAFGWKADREGVRLLNFGWVEDPTGLLYHARRAARMGAGLSDEEAVELLARWLIDPVRPLDERIYLLSSGPLNGYPFDVLLAGDGQVAVRHSVTQLMSLDVDWVGATDLKQPQHILLAGDPKQTGSSQSMLAAAGEEIDLIGRLFATSDITVWRGADLSLRAFESEDFADADLVHFASHATVDVAYPGLSSIMLSDGVLTPADLGRQPIHAELVVLSACDTAGVNQFTFDANLGFVSSLLSSGAQSVIASLWPVGDRSTAMFMSDFYSQLQQDGDAAAALRRAKQQWIEKPGEGSAATWAAFQIYQ